MSRVKELRYWCTYLIGHELLVEFAHAELKSILHQLLHPGGHFWRLLLHPPEAVLEGQGL